MPENGPSPAATTRDAGAPPLFVGVGENGVRVFSADGREWRRSALGKEGEIYRAVCRGNGRYVAVGTDFHLRRRRPLADGLSV